MKLVIVDDEKLERMGLSKLIEMEMPEIEIVGEAMNGRMAIELANELLPDIMMMDIKMPGIDGVQAVKEIRKTNKHIRFIMVSAFNTFEYAKEVMQQGVKEYLLKPSKKADVLSALKRVCAEIIEERRLQLEHQDMKENLSRALSVIETEWLSSLLLNQIEDMDFEEWSKLLGIEVKTGFIAIFSFKHLEGWISNEEKRVLYSELKSILKANTEMGCILGPMVDHKIPVLFLLNMNDEKQRFKTRAIKHVRSVIQRFQGEFKREKLYAGIGLPFETIERLPQSYHEAILALEQQDSKVIQFYDGIVSSDLQVTFEKEKELLEWIKMGDLHRTLQTFEVFVEANRDQGKKCFEELTIMISRLLGELGIYSEKRRLLDEKWIEKARQYVIESVEIVQAWRTSNQKSYLQKAKEYIEKNYEKNITLEEVAEFVGLSPFHFTKMFKEKFGITFIDYLTERRIEQAKVEILCTNKSLKEICFSVGYKDPNYFSRVFKKKTGFSPTSYRSETS